MVVRCTGNGRIAWSIGEDSNGHYINFGVICERHGSISTREDEGWTQYRITLTNEVTISHSSVCVDCTGTGKITRTIPCSHGLTATHRYCRTSRSVRLGTRAHIRTITKRHILSLSQRYCYYKRSLVFSDVSDGYGSELKTSTIGRIQGKRQGVREFTEEKACYSSCCNKDRLSK